jgi:ribulose kinase
VCAAVGAGLYPDFATAVAHMQRPRETFAPDAVQAALYARLEREVYRGIRDHTDQVLQRSWPIFQ